MSRSLRDTLNKPIAPWVAPHNIGRLGSGFLLSNMSRKIIYLNEDDLVAFLIGDLPVNSAAYHKLIQGGFIIKCPDEIFATISSKQLRKTRENLFWGTTLHIFVITAACNLECVYCQAHRLLQNVPAGNMSIEIARKAVDFALQAQNKKLTFEFQGGEPLLNFPAIKELILYGRNQAEKVGKTIRFDLVTNLTAMTSEKLDFLLANGINICVSLDGPQQIHDWNRPHANGNGSYNSVIHWIEEIRRLLVVKNDNTIAFNAIPTVTQKTISYPEELVDEFVRLGFKSVSIRCLSPLGRAADNWKNIGYSAEEFITFYEHALRYIIELNTRGIQVKEDFASMISSMVFDEAPVNHMEMRSPCGAGTGQLAYHWNGDVYTCDEARMLGENGDFTFRLGNVTDDNYKACLSSDTVKVLATCSCVESIPECQGCVYSPFCGVCPIHAYHENGSVSLSVAGGFRCKILMGQMNTIFRFLLCEDIEFGNVIRGWASGI